MTVTSVSRKGYIIEDEKFPLEGNDLKILAEKILRKGVQGILHTTKPTNQKAVKLEVKVTIGKREE